MTDTQNKNVLVVGGGTGIGAAIAHAFAQTGAKVAVAGRRAEVLQQTCDAFPQEAGDGGGQLFSHVVDVADRSSVDALIQWYGETLGEIHVLVNAAGINIKDRTMAAMQPDEWDRVMSVNATGAYNILAAVLPQMRERQDGVVVNISSIAGKRAIQLGGVAYCASKFAMTALGTAVAQEEAANGIRVTNVYPGEVETPLLLQRPEPVSEERRSKMLQPGDLAELVLTISRLPARAHVPEIVVKPLVQSWF